MCSCLDFLALESHHLKCSISPQKNSMQSPHHTSVEFLLPLMPYFVMGLWLYRQIWMQVMGVFELGFSW